ncbi:MAG: tripartite tricarboxylate transporter substrate binding protein BugD, partial [Hyphomicrobiales bacterium]
MKSIRPALKTAFASIAAFAAVLSVSAQAQDYPTRPVTFITPAAAGNSPDVVTRVVADRLA